MKIKSLIVFMIIFPSVLVAQNPTLETIFQRKSVRSYTERAISLDTLKILVKAGMAAPTGMNRQPWEFVVIYGKEEMKRLAEKIPGIKMLKEAQAAIVVAGNPELSQFWYEDCSAATQNILLAAESMGLGAVWTAGYPIEQRMNQIADALAIPLPYRPLCLIPIGYPKGPQQPKDKWKESKLHINRW
ncbi:MAG: nitroreductase family protein [Bacteroidales bacterium]|nr:nitroreductase family protein [Bacteroidales bacterium]MDD2425031.1 nitroreductase family protein [Bacteroidales bacterium]MDD3989328.1 nitroreductase family protein [Bacteroidales bacterium]